MAADTRQLDLLRLPPYPMLARVGKIAQLRTAIADGYMIEPKIDGIRCLVVIDRVDADTRMIRLFNRQLVDITGRFPDVVDEVRLKVRGVGHTLDGEIYVLGDDGHADFQRVQTRANRLRDVEAAAAAYPARFLAFDMLRYEGRPLTSPGFSLRVRRELMFEVCGQLVISSFTQDEANRIEANHEGEGLMLKHRSGAYSPGERSPAWLKVKWLREVRATVGGVTFGIGRRASTFGGLLVGVPMPADKEGRARLRYVGTVGTGFTNDRLYELYAGLCNLRTADCPFVERGADWDIQFFVRPIVQVRVAFSDYTRDGIMRFPRFGAVL